ncbi:MAG TPA: glycoside hydrolase family 43 protein [Candidatus Parabacteroides intestinavium]|nr:glycoside hydrolase family 43 protein [Candidatus Parabacteroides intestinavium]
MAKNLFLSVALACMAGLVGCSGNNNSADEEAPEKEPPVEVVSTTLPIADPYILLYDGMYYAYGTSGDNGFEVYTSDDLETWKRSSAMALNKQDSYADRWFWAPEVYYVEKAKKFYLFYSADEHICVATSDSPYGPFVQDEKKPIREEKSIDTSVFFDDDGKAYLYFVRFTDGNVIWVAELNDDLKSIKEETLTQCFAAEEPWELILPKVVEGPSVIKQGDTYYLMYSANGYTSQDYAVGYATSKSPFGPWKKYEKNPILHNYKGLVGVGHGAPFIDKEGKMRYVFHAHKSTTEIHPRDAYVVDMSLENGVITLDGNLVRPRVVK